VLGFERRLLKTCHSVWIFIKQPLPFPPCGRRISVNQIMALWFSEFSHFSLYRGNIIYPYFPLLACPCLSCRISILNALELLLTGSISSLPNLYYPDVFRTYAPIPSNTLQAVAITACALGSVLIKSIGRRPPRPGILSCSQSWVSSG
jgi:hypothetical protein